LHHGVDEGICCSTELGVARGGSRRRRERRRGRRRRTRRRRRRPSPPGYTMTKGTLFMTRTTMSWRFIY
jgi:hypothetical protein